MLAHYAKECLYAFTVIATLNLNNSNHKDMAYITRKLINI